VLRDSTWQTCRGQGQALKIAKASGLFEGERALCYVVGVSVAAAHLRARLETVGRTLGWRSMLSPARCNLIGSSAPTHLHSEWIHDDAQSCEHELLKHLRTINDSLIRSIRGVHALNLDNTMMQIFKHRAILVSAESLKGRD